MWRTSVIGHCVGGGYLQPTLSPGAESLLCFLIPKLRSTRTKVEALLLGCQTWILPWPQQGQERSWLRTGGEFKDLLAPQLASHVTHHSIEREEWGPPRVLLGVKNVTDRCLPVSGHAQLYITKVRQVRFVLP